MTLKARLVLGMLAALVAGGTAYAGWQTNVTTVVNSTYGYAYGQFANSRASSISYDYLYCSVSASEGSPVSGWCTASNGSSYGYCYTDDPALVSVLQTLSGDSHLSFNWNTATGRCTLITVTEGSVYAPKR